MTTDSAAFPAEAASTDAGFRIPSGYERWVRFGATWTMIIHE